MPKERRLGVSVTTADKISLATAIVQGLGFIATIGAGVFALKTFRRSEQWKRAEFVADEMKEFFANKHVQRSLMMIDWDTRPITLLDPTGSDDGTVAVTRELQVQALLPHTLVDNSGSGLDGYRPRDTSTSPWRKQRLGIAMTRSLMDLSDLPAMLRPTSSRWMT